MIPINLFILFFRVGLFSFGGGNTMIAQFQRMLVVDLGYITNEQFLDIVAISQITPGPVAVNIATYVGAALGETPIQSVFYSFVATVGIALPAFIIILVVLKIINSGNRYVDAALAGIKPGVIGLIIGSVVLLARYSLFKNGAVNVAAVALASLAVLLSKKMRLNPIIILFSCGFINVLLSL